jgi:hypothetical protein
MHLLLAVILILNKHFLLFELLHQLESYFKNTVTIKLKSKWCKNIAICN